MTTFGKLGVAPGTIGELETYVCNMYSKPKLTSLTSTRQDMYFLHRETSLDHFIKSREQILLHYPLVAQYCSKKFNVLILTPQSGKNAFSPEPMQYNTVGSRWFLENGCYTIKWHEGQPVQVIYVVTLTIEEVITSTLKVISANTRVILDTNKLVSATEIVV